MIADLIRAAVQLVMRDKIVAGLVIVMIAGIFFMGGGGKDKQSHRFMGQGQNQNQSPEDNEGQEQGAAEQPKGSEQDQKPGSGQGQGQNQNQNQSASTPQNNALTQAMQKTLANRAQNVGGTATTSNVASLSPPLAVEFVRWWLTMALDYSLTTAAPNHKKAMSYAQPQVARMFKQSFYTDAVMQGVAAGTLAGSFQPVTVTAIAVNPDGSVVVTVIGNLTLQSSGSQPVSQSLEMEFLVTKDGQGVRMAGFFNKTVTAAPAQQAAGVETGPEVEEQSTRRRPLSGGF